MPALAAGVAVVAMGIKLSSVKDQAPSALSAAGERLRAAFILLLGFMLTALRTIFLPHLMAVMVLLAVSCCAVYKAVMGVIPVPFSWVLFVGVVVLYGVLAMGYTLVLSAVFGVRAAAARVEDFLYELFESLKDKVRSKIDNMEEGISKQQAKVILDNSVREVFSPLKKFRFESAPKAAAAVLLAALTFVTRAVFFARVGQIASNTIRFSSVFASRATLIGALFLNLRWLAALVLWLLYGLGILFFIFNLWLLFF